MVRRIRTGSVEGWSNNLLLIALPMILAGGGWVIQENQAIRSLQKDYVQLAVDILRSDPKKDDDAQQLRTWAVKVVDAYAPVKLTPEAQSELIESGFGKGFEARAFGAFAIAVPDSDVSQIVLRPTKEQCRQAYIISNDPKWLERCLSSAAETEKKQSSQVAPKQPTQ